MRVASIVCALSVAATAVVAVPPGYEPPPTEPGEVTTFEALSSTPCVGGMAGPYPCLDVDLLAFVPNSTMNCGTGNDIWGWTDPSDGTEYALMGCNNGTAFVDLSDPKNPVYLGRLPTHTGSSTWRDVKVYADHAYVVSDGNGSHGMQVFDLTRLRNVSSPPAMFTHDAWYSGINSAHNVAINEDTGFAYIVGGSSGGNTCAGGLHIVDIQDPTSPTFTSCFAADGYTHDTQCVIYHGPDTLHQGREICFNSNGNQGGPNTLTIVDVTDKSSPVMVARKTYDGSRYAHQGWLTEDHRYFLLDDELDELNLGHNTRTRIWDVTTLADAAIIGTYDSPVASTDHNLYVKGSYVYQSNYTSGLRILDLSEVADGTLTEVAYFDVFPANNNPGFDGAWSNYPYFDSGIVIVSARGTGGGPGGLFVLRPNLEEKEPSLSIDDASVEEGHGGLVEMEFHVSLSAKTGGTVTVDYETEDDTAVAGIDYVAASGTLTFEPGEVAATIAVQIIPNTEPQDDRTFFVHLSSPNGATIERGTATGTIIDDDEAQPRLSVNDPVVVEGDGEPVDLPFLVSFSIPSEHSVSFDYATADGTAVAGVDYEPVSGTATVEPGGTQARIDVPVLGNLIPQHDRTLFLEISNPVNAVIVRGTGVGTIVDDDSLEVHGFEPSSGAAAGGETLLVTGESFLPGVEVEFGVTPAAEIDVVSDTLLAATTPELAAGELFDVHVFFGGHEHLTTLTSRSHPQHKRYLADYLDVPRSHPFHDPVEILRRLDLTGGCGDGLFCVEAAVSRAQMAVFLLNAYFGGGYTPPACTGVFADLPCPSPFADWIEDLYVRGITGGCGTEPLRYCPNAAVNRGQMAVFLLRTLDGEGSPPAACEGLFEDVPCPSDFADWIEELVNRDFAAGCSAQPALFCPENDVLRGQMAAFLVQTFTLPFEW